MQIQECQGFELHILHLEHFSLLLQILSGIVFVRDIVPISSPTQRNPQNPTPYSNPLTQYMAFPSDSFSTWLLKGKLGILQVLGKSSLEILEYYIWTLSCT